MVVDGAERLCGGRPPACYGREGGLRALLNHRERSRMHGPGVAVERHHVALVEQRVPYPALPPLEIDLETRAGHQAHLAELTCDDRRMRGPAAGPGQDSDGLRHAHDVRRHRVPAYENCRFAGRSKAQDRSWIERDRAACDAKARHQGRRQRGGCREREARGTTDP